ncbi:hypothetical protein IFM89_002295 [Coptis chinensis]|uniref:Uncharacterized protein n=1 Tax=Coptis chinensis TaxID=261450 RepID=A0A835IIN7_9MAGN|nr:hypothetical protein IFM89_002295 [Coptis chinensis]
MEITMCNRCGDNTHSSDKCGWLSTPCCFRNCRGSRTLKQSGQTQSLGKKFFTCRVCRDFQWLEDARASSVMPLEYLRCRQVNCAGFRKVNTTMKKNENEGKFFLNCTECGKDFQWLEELLAMLRNNIESTASSSSSPVASSSSSKRDKKVKITVEIDDDAPPIIFKGKSPRCILPAIDVLSIGNALVGIFYLIGFGLFCESVIEDHGLFSKYTCYVKELSLLPASSTSNTDLTMNRRQKKLAASAAKGGGATTSSSSPSPNQGGGAAASSSAKRKRMQEVMNVYLHYSDQVMVDISNEDGDWATNMCNDACPYEEIDYSDTEINVGEGSTNVSLEDEDESDDHSVSEIEGFERQSNEADARSEQTNENDFNLFSGKLGGGRSR